MRAGRDPATALRPACPLHPCWARQQPTRIIQASLLSCTPADACIFFVGTTSAGADGPQERTHFGSYSSFSPVVESEGMDRRDLTLPGLQLNVIQVGAEPGCLGIGERTWHC